MPTLQVPSKTNGGRLLAAVVLASLVRERQISHETDEWSCCKHNPHPHWMCLFMIPRFCRYRFQKPLTSRYSGLSHCGPVVTNFGPLITGQCAHRPDCGHIVGNSDISAPDSGPVRVAGNTATTNSVGVCSRSERKAESSRSHHRSGAWNRGHRHRDGAKG